MTTRSGVGWVLIFLAVPGFMFYSWWSNLNADRKRELAVKAKKRMPEGALFSGQDNNATKLTNPISTETEVSTAPAPAPAVSTAAPLAAAAEPVEAAAAVEPPAEEPAPAAEQPPAAEQAPVKQEAPANAPVPASGEVSLAEASSNFRDPTLSPYDVYRLEQIKLEQMLIRREVETTVVHLERKPKKVKREPPIESTIALQGIVSNPDGKNSAIVNGEMVSEGDVVGKEVKVLSITPSDVTFLHKKKKFTKTVSK